MKLGETLHHFISQYNPLKKPEVYVQKRLEEHPPLRKTALIADHLFRSLIMASPFSLFPKSPLLGAAACFGGALFYRLTVEPKCDIKITLPSFAGAMALAMGKQGLAQLANRTAFTSAGSCLSTAASLAPLALYLIYVICTVSYDIDHPSGRCSKGF